jgi:hypothetical protein
MLGASSNAFPPSVRCGSDACQTCAEEEQGCGFGDGVGRCGSDGQVVVEDGVGEGGTAADVADGANAFCLPSPRASQS